MSMQGDKLFRVLFEQAAVGVGLLDTRTGQLLRVNRKYLQIVGYEAEELVGIDFMRITHPDDLADDLVQMERLKAGLIREFSMEKRLLRRDGTPVWVELTVSPTWAPGEAPTQHIAVVVEITARKAAEQRTEQARAELESTLEALPDLLFDLDDEGYIHDYRAPVPERLLVPPSQFLGRPMFDFLPPEASASIQAAMRETLESGRSSGRHYRLEMGGESRWFEVSMARKPLDGGGGRPRMIAIVRDITERVVAEQQRQSLEAQLRQAQKLEALGTLAGGIAHDFNNLLAVIGLSVERARKLLPGESPAGEQLEVMGEAVRRGADLIQQILAFSRRQPARREPVSVNQAVVEAAGLLRASLSTGVELRVAMGSDAPHICADPTQLQQVLINLGMNALQAMGGRAGTIDLGVSTVAIGEGHASLVPGPYVRIVVADAGEGMDPSTLERIFEPFFTTKAPGQGSGLGLSVVHGIVTEHGGAIEVESQPGRGSVFAILLPAGSAPCSPRFAATAPSEVALAAVPCETRAARAEDLS